MSILETPRINFMGQIAWDPIVTNNYAQYYNESTSETVMAPGESVNAFRQSAIDIVTSLPLHNWNPHGTHRSVFFNTYVNTVDIGQGLTTEDPVCGHPMNLIGMLVDLEPYGVMTSQLYFDTLSMGVEGGASIQAKRTQRFNDRYINFQRNSQGYIAGVASVGWQTTFPKDEKVLCIQSHDSPALNALQQALQAPDVLGLTVRFNTYRTIYFNNDTLRNKPPGQPNPDVTAEAKVLQDKLNQGGFQPNPARSILVGSIGLWRDGECRHEPSDRALVPNPTSKLPVATAHARLIGDWLMLDLSNSIAETDVNLTKLDLGTLYVTLVDPVTGDEIGTLGVLEYEAYCRQAYDLGAGIVSMQIDPSWAEVAEKGNLVLRQADGTVLLRELAQRALPLRPNIYVNESDNSFTLAFQVYDRGQPARSAVPVTVYQMSADGGSIDATFNLLSSPQGVVSMTASVTAGGGICAYVAVPQSAADISVPANGINSLVNTFSYVRTLAADSAIASLEPTWENVYAHVLSNWKAMAPCMDNWLDLSNPDQVKAYGSVIKKLTDPKAFESFRFMPVTRDLTEGQRRLLYGFLDAGKTDAQVGSLKEMHSAPGVNFATLSRTLR